MISLISSAYIYIYIYREREREDDTAHIKSVVIISVANNLMKAGQSVGMLHTSLLQAHIGFFK